jgi:5-methylcytosine-specific restriction protein A
LYSFENHQAYASQIGLILGHTGKTPQSPINLEIGKYAKRIAQHYDIEFTKRKNQQFKYWDLFFNGWNDGSFFMWQLRPEIVEALEKNKLTGIELITEEISTEESEDLFEGAKKIVTINAYERNPKARSLCLGQWGTKCAICGFDFEKVYGEIGKGFIHVHHLIPVSQIGKTYQVDPISDLIPVCPNCHAMIHTKNPPLTIEELKKKINNNV